MKKFFVLSATIFLLAAGCNEQVVPSTGPGSSVSQSANSRTQKQAPITKPNDKPISQAEQSATTTTQVAQNPNIISHTVGQATKPEYKPGYIIITQTVEGSNLNGPYLQLLQGATAQDSLTIAHNIVFKDYGSMGIFVQTIDGVTSDSKHYWEFFVNGKSSNVGASSYILKNGDSLEWKIATPDGSD